MVLNRVDDEMAEIEEDASPTVFPTRISRASLERRNSLDATLAHIPTASSSSSSEDAASARHRHASGEPGPSGLNRTLSIVDLERIQTAKSQRSGTVGRSHTGSRSHKPLPAFGAGKPYPPQMDQEKYVVEFDGPDDPLHAQNWPLKKKLYTAAILGFTTMTAAFTSSIFSAATSHVAAEYHVSAEVGTLGVSFYVMGFAFGPTLWAPLSELKGRVMPLAISMFGFSVFCIAVATAKDLQTVLICRFFGGFFGACPLAVVAAVFSDMFGNQTRGIAITIFSMAVFSGPLLAPFIGGFISTSYLGWRWTQYIPAFMGFFCFALIVLFQEETYPPAILVQKASNLRRATLNWGIHARQDEIEVDLKELITKNFSRPMRLLFLEPIVTSLSVYMAFVYGILYLFLTAYPFVFQKVHHMTPGVGGLPFFGMIIGQLLSGLSVLLQQPWYNRKLAANNNVPIPEWRLPSVIAGGVSFTCGIFWFGWSGYKESVHWIVPTLSGLMTGFGLMSIFLQSLNYLVDAYLMFAASAIAGNTFLRSLCGAGFPLFATYMFNGMGIEWASTLLGCVGGALVPIPVIFYIYGEKIRGMSSYAPGGQAGKSSDEDEPEPVGVSRAVANGDIEAGAVNRKEE
ncbi:major facilitator superfamily transporter multidrug resistance [Grosmannia clavigera kw1407]|uniref:Major facilitator superfamily transporter multidrug resistance n=1 Tax=Grosmannia clavigera (strain kw1407 / UAMH 11150) TaxID=655863 RepID=F0XTW1_GROCL|nr:major facilitator superfamily transporter multidrug resistance [Grosmannia clavigera kw1407]EFW98522.1 major facilitator superfamily transporter multidrug resistance [Grosmannia clavigera kw1407]